MNVSSQFTERNSIPHFRFVLLCSLVMIAGCQEDMPNGNGSIDDMTVEEETAVATLAPASGSNVSGEVRFYEDGDDVVIELEANGLQAGAHGFHIHEYGDCSAVDASSAGDHFDPEDNQHGAPSALNNDHHVGDLGNIQASGSGTARLQLSNPDISLDAPNSIIGRAIIIHAQRDDLQTQPSGNSGDPVACGVIQFSQSA